MPAPSVHRFSAFGACEHTEVYPGLKCFLFIFLKHGDLLQWALISLWLARWESTLYS